MSNETMEQPNTLEYYRTRLCSPIGTTENSTPEPPARRPFFPADEPRLNINSSHPPELAATMQIYNNLGKLLDPGKAAMFPHLPPELRLQIWKEKFASWAKTQPRVRILVPASPVVLDKIICDELKDLPDPHPNFFSTGCGKATEICPLLTTSSEARKIALEQIAGSLDVCSCVRRQCAQCRDMEFELGTKDAQECDCKQFCQENCRGKTYFTEDQIFYIPGFATISNWIENLFDPEFPDARDFYKIDDGNDPLAWAFKLQNVALEAHHLAGQSGEWLKDILSKFKSLKKLYLVWRFDPRGDDFVTRYASSDNENKIILTLEAQLKFLEEAFFESPELWLNQLPGVDIEFISVPVKFTEAARRRFHNLSPEVIDRSVKALEEYFTPGNHARKMVQAKREAIQANIDQAKRLLQNRRRDVIAFLRGKRRNLKIEEQSAEQLKGADKPGMYEQTGESEFEEDSVSDCEYEDSSFTKWERDQIISIEDMIRYLRDLEE